MLKQPNNGHIGQLTGNVLHRVGTGCIKQGVQRAAVKAEPYQGKQQRRIQQQFCPKRQECQGVRQRKKDPYTRRQPRNEAAAALPPRDKQAGAQNHTQLDLLVQYPIYDRHGSSHSFFAIYRENASVKASL